MPTEDRPLVWLHGSIRSPPFSRAARHEAGYLLRRLQEGELLGMPHSRPMGVVGPRCHELRVPDQNASWRIVYRLDPEEVLIIDVIDKRTQKAPLHILRACRQRLKNHEEEG